MTFGVRTTTYEVRPQSLGPSLGVNDLFSSSLAGAAIPPC